MVPAPVVVLVVIVIAVVAATRAAFRASDLIPIRSPTGRRGTTV